MIKIPQCGEFYKLASDLNSPKYEINDGDIFGSYSNTKEITDWYRLKEGDLLFYVGLGNNIGTNNIPAKKIASIRAYRKYGFKNLEKIEQHFIWKENFVTIILTEKDWQFFKKTGKYE